MRLDRWLVQCLPDRTRNQIQNDIDAGRVKVDGSVRPARYAVREGERVLYDVPEIQGSELKPEAIALNVVYEDEHLIVIDKPAGLVVHPAPGHNSGTVANALLHHCGSALEGVGGEERWGIVHRLDAQTSGLMMAAKTPEAYEVLVDALAKREVSRRYLGIVTGSFKVGQGDVDAPIGRRTSDRKKMGVRSEGGREAQTHWDVLCQSDGLSLLGLTLHTGRTHQIRVHMQSIGRPILADPEYGWTRPRTLQAVSGPLRPRIVALWPGRQMLHAARLHLMHPIQAGRALDFQSPPPADMLAILNDVWGEVWPGVVETWLKAPVAPPPSE